MGRFSKDALENATVLSESHVAGKSLMTPDDLANILSVNRQTIFRWVREGKLGCVKLSFKKRRFTMDQIQEFVDRHTISPPKSVDNVQPKDFIIQPAKQNISLNNTGDTARVIRKELSSWQ